ncbi:MAG TPA: hypothetical protein VGV59_12770 [Pyrinomonadaceae bacterium]|nr:hypothetical protein [Pyrinomonadaceae bacterium]
MRRASFVAGAALAVLLCVAPVSAQESSKASFDGLSQARAALAGSAEEVKKNTQELIALKEDELAAASHKQEQLRQLYDEGLIAQREMEEDERRLAELRATVADLRRQIAESERVIAEVEAAEEARKKAQAEASVTASLSKTVRPPGAYSATSTVIRHTGSNSWTVANLSSVQAFFASTFGRALPVSAYGQTATHTRLGFDHSRAVDVALHPDSTQGRALISYLQSRGITFIAFRGAVPGAATGAHIHIGAPSHRIG